ncbi:MAG: glycosyltransferase [Deltaproteobacteria bacterium]|nr:glycosyltransferase [Deltaproteobacteria bacterium]
MSNQADILFYGSFEAERSWLGRKIRIEYPRPVAAPDTRVVMGDLGVILSLLRRDEQGLEGRGIVAFDSIGQDRLATEDAFLLSRAGVCLVSAIMSDAEAYKNMGLFKAVFAPAAVMFFPLMLEDFKQPSGRRPDEGSKRVVSPGRIWRDFETLRLAAERLERTIHVVTDLGRITLGPSRWIEPLDLMPFDQLCDFMAGSACVVVCTRPGNPAGQATAALSQYLGVPTVATDLPALCDCMGVPRSILMVPPEDPSSLADAIRKVQDDRELASGLSDAALKSSARLEAGAAGVMNDLLCSFGV